MIKVSIILPVFNERQDYLRMSLQSIRNQSFKNWECIIVAESTKMENINLISEYCELDSRFKLIRPRNRIGLAESLNVGVKQAQASLIARMDSDDIMSPKRLELQIEYLKEHSNVDVLGSSYETIDENHELLGVRYYPLGGIKLWFYFLFRSALAHPTVVFKKASFLEVGGYDKNLRYCEDLDLWLRMKNAGYILQNMPDILLQYRVTKRRNFAHWFTMLSVRVKNFYE